MTNVERKTIRKYIESIYSIDLGGNIQDAIDILQDTKSEVLSQGYHNVLIFENYNRYEIYGERFETDEEYQERLKKEKKQKAIKTRNDLIRKKNKDEKDRKEYERLKKKFGG